MAFATMALAPRRLWTRIGRAAAALTMAAAIGVAVAPAPAAAQTAEEISRIENYLNSIGSMRARFLQVDPSGGNIQGTLFILRPGRLRFEYDDPSPILVVADGTWVHYYDRELDQTSRALISDTTVEFFTRNDLKLSGDVRITSFVKEAGRMTVTLVDANNPEEGSVAFTFAEDPINLLQWVVTDPEGAQTLVALLSFETNVQLDQGMFIDPSVQ